MVYTLNLHYIIRQLYPNLKIGFQEFPFVSLYLTCPFIIHLLSTNHASEKMKDMDPDCLLGTSFFQNCPLNTALQSMLKR